MSQWWRVRNTGRRDGVEPGIVRVLRGDEFGGPASVFPIGEPCDLIVGFLGRTHLVENKTGNGKLTPAQVEFRKSWRGEPPVTIRTEAHARKWKRTWLEQAKRSRVAPPSVLPPVEVDGECSDCGAACACTPASDRRSA